MSISSSDGNRPADSTTRIWIARCALLVGVVVLCVLGTPLQRAGGVSRMAASVDLLDKLALVEFLQRISWLAVTDLNVLIASGLDYIAKGLRDAGHDVI